MNKQTKTKDEPRRIGPKFARNVIPEGFQIRRPTSPMAELLNEASREREAQRAEPDEQVTPVKITPVKSTPVKNTGVAVVTEARAAISKSLPDLDAFIDHILPRFPPARQAILLRLFRWSEGSEREIVVSTPKLAAKTNMDEKSCRMHLHALIADGFLNRSMDGEQIARFGGSNRASRGLLLKLSAQTLHELLD
ncbi:MAG TPA: hypothetical protein VF525_19555 [Pyrinomonadaceae bacterium]|jgi:hypothetical protein